jgi:hypothetical protein
MEEHLMKTDNLQKLRADRVWLTKDACDLDDFRAEVEKTTDACRLSDRGAVEKNVLIYDSRKVTPRSPSPAAPRRAGRNLRGLRGRPGVVVFKHALRGHRRHRSRQRDFR